MISVSMEVLIPWHKIFSDEINIMILMIIVILMVTIMMLITMLMIRL